MSITGYDPGPQQPSRTFPDRLAGQVRDPVRGPHASASQVCRSEPIEYQPVAAGNLLIDRLWPPFRFRPRCRPICGSSWYRWSVAMTDMPILDEIGSIVDRFPSAGTSSFASCRQSPRGASWRRWPEEPLQPAAQDSHLEPGSSWRCWPIVSSRLNRRAD